ncbi:caspase family protein [Spirosoma koreense]
MLVVLVGWQLTACSLRPGRSTTTDGDVVQPLWLDQRTTNLPVDTIDCAKVVVLLIGISQYDPASGWETLNAENDVLLMETNLRQRGVRPQHIHRLTDRQATKAGIEQALKMLADTLQQGDQLLIHYAGHARQLVDDNGDETDGYDEAIVPYDAPPVHRLQPDGYLRDDDLNRYLTGIRTALGPTGLVWLLFDSCHSATLNRGKNAQRLRGGGAPLGRPTRQSGWVNESRRTTSGWYEMGTKPGAMAPYILFAATTDGGESYETIDASGRSFGPLTRALCEVWSTPSTSEPYRQLFERMAVVMARYAPYQRPSLEGDSEVLALGCGAAATSRPVGYRTVGEPLRVTGPPQDAALIKTLTSLSFVRMTTSQPQLRIDRQGRGYQLRLTANNQLLAGRIGSVDECAEKIRQYFARNVLMQLQQKNPAFAIETKMQRVQIELRNGHSVVTDTLPALMTAGLATFRASATERVVLTLTNTGPHPVYITLVDLPPDGRLQVLIPETGHAATEYRLTPGQSLSRRIRITEPLGAELYKLLLTPEPIGLESIVQTRGNYPVRHPYEALFQRMYATRGQPETASIKLSDNAGATADVLFWTERP